MNQNLLRDNIIAARQSNAPKLESLLTTVEKLRAGLQEVDNSPLTFMRPSSLRALQQQAASLQQRIERKHEQFQKGVVTLCVAGLEKSGKSTMLKTLTGVALPAAAQRCTSVNTEIYFDRSKQSFDVVYYTREELYRLMSMHWQFLRAGGAAIWESSQASDLAGDVPPTLEAFLSCTLPTKLESLSEMKYRSSLETLIALQNCRDELRVLGTTESGLPLEQLSAYVSHKTEQHAAPNRKQVLMRKVMVSVCYDGGCEALRLCDTPGVDDPNPNAREVTLRMVQEEADVLLLLNRPLTKPDPTESFTNFLEGLARLDADAPLRKRLLYMVNQDKRSDPDGAYARLHLQAVDKHFDEILPPVDALSREELRARLDAINAFMAERLPQMDRELITKFEQEVKSLQSRVRLEIFDDLRRQSPPLPGDVELQIHNLYTNWFSGFMDRLVTGLGKLSTNPALPELDQVHQSIEEKLKAVRTTMKEALQAEGNEQVCEQLLLAGKNPSAVLLPRFAALITGEVEKLTAEVETLCPAIRSCVLQKIREALGDAADALMPGTRDEEQLTALCDLLEESAQRQAQDEHILFVLAGLREFATLNAQMRYVMRYEMRPALNLFDPLRWRAGRVESLRKRCLSMLPAGHKVAARLQRTTIPGPGDAAAVHAGFLNNICAVAWHLLSSVLGAQATQLQQMVDDFLSQASQTLATQASCKTGWERGLNIRSSRILGKEAEHLVRKAEQSAAFNDLLKQLEQTLS